MILGPEVHSNPTALLDVHILFLIPERFLVCDPFAIFTLARPHNWWRADVVYQHFLY